MLTAPMSSPVRTMNLLYLYLPHIIDFLSEEVDYGRSTSSVFYSIIKIRSKESKIFLVMDNGKW